MGEGMQGMCRGEGRESRKQKAESRKQKAVRTSGGRRQAAGKTSNAEISIGVPFLPPAPCPL
jgi:hypothetical protein